MENTIKEKIAKLKSLDCGWCSLSDIVDAIVPHSFGTSKIKQFRDELVDLLKYSDPNNWNIAVLEDEYGLVLLPRDKDGEFLHVGDMVYDLDGNKWFVYELRIGTGYIRVRKDGGVDRVYQTAQLTHREPMTVESVLRGFAQMCHDCCDTPENIAEYAKLLRLAEDDE